MSDDRTIRCSRECRPERPAQRCGRIIRHGWRAAIFVFASTLAFAFAAPLYASERDALIHFYNATNGDTWNDHTGWLGPVGTECTWFGVNCGPDGHVVVLNLHGNGLQGPIPDLSGLTELEGLVLSQNALSGPIPDLSTLIHLKSVVLRHNNLVGAFPA